MNPFTFLKEAIKAVPAVKYALGVGGIVATVAIIASFNINLKIALFGTLITIILMVVLLVFAKLSTAAAGIFKLPFLVLTWFSILIFISTTILLFISVFFKYPINLSHWLTYEIGIIEPKNLYTVKSIDSLQLGDKEFSEYDRFKYRKEKYFLGLTLTGKFASDRYNTQPYHQSISEIRKSDQGVEIEDLRVFEHNIALDTISDDNYKANYSSWLIIVGLTKLPKDNDTLLLNFGAVKKKFDISDLTWEEHVDTLYDGSVKFSEIARASTKLIFPNPTWGIISDSRILKNEDGEELLDLLIVNHSSEPISLSNLVLKGTKYTFSSGHGIIGPQWQDLILDWGQVQELDNNVNEIDSWTSLGQQTVKATARFRPGNQSGYNDVFVVDIPVQIDLAAKETKRFGLRIVDRLPSSSRYSRLGLSNFFNRNLTQSRNKKSGLLSWDELVIVLMPEQVIYPSKYELSTEGKGVERMMRLFDSP